MSNEVQFDIDQVQRTSFKPKGSLFVRLVMNNSRGLIKDERQANYVLIGLSVLALMISLYLFSGGTPKQQKLTPEELKIIEQMNQVRLNR